MEVYKGDIFYIEKGKTEEKEPDDQMEETANRLQHEASVKCSRELEKAQKYKEGYTQGVEDLLRCIRRGE